MKFDTELRTKSGYVCGCKFEAKNDTEVAAPTISRDTTIDINKFHDVLGHCGESKMRAVANYYGVKLTGNLRACENCAKAKAHQANIPKSINKGKKSKKPGE